MQIGPLGLDRGQALHARFQRLAGAEHRRVLLGRHLHLQAKVGGRNRAPGVAQPVEPRQVRIGPRRLHLALAGPALEGLGAMQAHRATEHNQIDQGI